jgi:hypothetical protein
MSISSEHVLFLRAPDLTAKRWRVLRVLVSTWFMALAASPGALRFERRLRNNQ